MGLFKRKNKDKDDDFILDFGGEDSAPSQSAGNDEDEELNITLWDDRKPYHRPSHAMTVSEILGNFSDEVQNTETPEEENLLSKAEELFSDSKPIEKGAVIEPPRDTPPAVSGDQEHAETETVVKSPQVAPSEIKVEADTQNSAAKKAEALIDRLMHQTETAEKPEPETAVNQSKAEVAAEEPAAKTTADQPKAEAPTHEPQPKEPEAAAVVTQPAADSAPAEASEPNTPTAETPEKQETKLSPTAQALYDKMMAERAKMHSSKNKESKQMAESSEKAVCEEPTEVIADTAEETPAEPLIDFKNEDVTLTSDIIPGTEKTPEKKSESIADAIFDSLNESFKKENPLSRKMEQSADSLLSKCKSYVNPAYDIEISGRSIDDIIQSAEKGARERLSNLYEVHNSEAVADIRHTHEFSPFLQRGTEGLDGKTISIPVKIQDETSEGAVISSSSGDIKNFQYSFADGESESPDTDATQVIDLPSSSAGHVTDPVKIQVMQLHLQSLAEKEEEEVSEPLKFRGSVEDELPEADVSEFADDKPVVDDYKTVADIGSIRTDFGSQRLSIIARLIPSAVICVLLFVINIFFKESLLEASGLIYSTLNIILLLIVMGINFKTLKGFAGIVGGTADIDSPAALGVISVLFYTLATTVMGETAAPCLTPTAALILCGNLYGKLAILKRVRRGFDSIANNDVKNAVTFVEDKYSASVMANGEVIGEALICQGKKTRNVGDYLKNAFMEDAYEKKLPAIIIFTIISAAVLALAAFFVNGSVLAAIAAFATVCCVGCPISAIYSCNLPLSILSKKLSSYGAMLSGYAASEAIANANAVAFDAADLFPKGSIKLYNMQVLNTGAVDKYIAAAAAVLTAAGSPLAPIFEEILETNHEKMPEADSIKYENNMGLSGWIGEHRVFVGNRTLMEGHSIKTPGLELDKKILRQGYFPVYLAFDQQICALFIVGYEADEDITYELRNLCNTGVTMLVNSNDPNISDEMLCDYFGLYPDSIKVLTASGTAAYKTVGEFRETVSAPASYSDNIAGFLATVSGSIKMKSIVTMLIVIQFILIAAGIAVASYSVFTTGILSLSALVLPAFHVIGTAITSLVAHLKQP